MSLLAGRESTYNWTPGSLPVKQMMETVAKEEKWPEA
jgi:hypothetical protein